MKTILFFALVLMNFSTFAASTASLGESLKPEDCVATAADKARAAKEFATAMDDVKSSEEATKTSEK